MSRAGWLGALVAAGIALQASGAYAAWVVDEHGECVRLWTPASLLRGPTAIANAPLVPFRSAAGGALVARDDPAAGGVKRTLLLGPTLAVAGGAMGVVESAVWLGGGLADTLTGGYFNLAPEEATELDVAPLRPLFAADARQAPRHPAPTDPCGRPAT